MAIGWAPSFRLSVLASSRRLSRPVEYALAAFTHVQKSRRKLPLWHEPDSCYLYAAAQQAAFTLHLAFLSELPQNSDVLILPSPPDCHFQKGVTDKYGATRLQHFPCLTSKSGSLKHSCQKPFFPKCNFFFLSLFVNGN